MKSWTYWREPLVRSGAACLLSCLTALVGAATVGTNFVRVGQKAVLGGSTFTSGVALTNGSITWDYTGGFHQLRPVTIPTARIQGNLYQAAFGLQKAAIRIRFRTVTSAGFQVLHEEFRQFQAHNASPTTPPFLPIDIRFSDPALRSVEITTLTGSALVSGFQTDGSTSRSAPQLQVTTRLLGPTNSSQRDVFGGLFGRNQSEGRVKIVFDPRVPFGSPAALEGSVEGYVSGDSQTQLRIIYRDSDLNSIGNATFIPVSQFRHSRVNRNLSEVELNFDNGNPAFTRRFFFLGQQIGLLEGNTAEPTRVGETTRYSIQWVVPGSLSWRTLESMITRVVDDENHVALQFHWDETSNTFRRQNPHDGKLSKPHLPGSPVTFEDSHVSLNLAETSVVGSWPTGQSVVLNLGLAFKPQAYGRTYRVEVLAANDFGVSQAWELGNDIHVVNRKAP